MDLTHNPYYQRPVDPPVSSILMSRKKSINHLHIPPNTDNLKFEDAIEALDEMSEGIDYKEV